jgi:hypothetical protein
MARRGWILLSVALVVATGAAALVFGLQIQIGPVIAVCRTDDDIDPADRRAVDNAALAFLQTFLSSTPQGAYADMSPLGQKSVTPVQFEAVARQLQVERSTGDRSVSRTYEVEGVSGAGPAAKGSCSEPGKPGRMAFVSIGGGGVKQAHVLVAEPLENAQRTFDVWMSSRDGGWRVNGVFGTLSQIASKDGEALWSLARTQRARGHGFNATLLYATAAQTLSRGPYVQLGVWPDFQKDFGSFSAPAELKGPPPFRWILGGQAFSVAKVEYNGVNDGKVVLVLDQTPAPWLGEADADRRNHQLIDAFMNTHPEWIETFTANNFYGSVYERGVGYLPQKPSS